MGLAGLLSAALFRAVPSACPPVLGWQARCVDGAGELGDIQLTSLLFILLLLYSFYSYMLTYFTSKSVFCWRAQQCLGDLPIPGQFWGRWYGHSFFPIAATLLRVGYDPVAEIFGTDSLQVNLCIVN